MKYWNIEWKNIGWTEDLSSRSIEKINTQSGEYEDLYFLPDGEPYWVFEGWTKGFVLNLHRITAASYEIDTIDGKQFLFMEWKMGNYIYGGIKPSIYVFANEYQKKRAS